MNELELIWTLSYFIDYAQIALENYTIIEPLGVKRKILDKKVSSPGDASSGEVLEWVNISNKISKHSRIVIIFCALSLEAYINDYAINRTSKSYLKNYLDKLDLYSKWVVIPRLLTGSQLDTAAQPMQDLDWLIKQRNKLVHFKTEMVEAGKVITKMGVYNEQVAQKALDTVKNAVLALHKIDKEAYISWLKYKGEWFPGKILDSP
jgi:hypothetical protein